MLKADVSTRRTYMTPVHVNRREQTPGIALLAIRLDRRAGLEAGALGQNQVGKGMHIDEVIVVAQRLPQQALERDLVDVRVEVHKVEVDVDHALGVSV